jgi:hypothetical protein
MGESGSEIIKARESVIEVENMQIREWKSVVMGLSQSVVEIRESIYSDGGEPVVIAWESWVKISGTIF